MFFWPQLGQALVARSCLFPRQQFDCYLKGVGWTCPFALLSPSTPAILVRGVLHPVVAFVRLFCTWSFHRVGGHPQDGCWWTFHYTCSVRHCCSILATWPKPFQYSVERFALMVLGYISTCQFLSSRCTRQRSEESYLNDSSSLYCLCIDCRWKQLNWVIW